MLTSRTLQEIEPTIAIQEADYIIVGGGPAGQSALQAIQETDSSSSILLVTEDAIDRQYGSLKTAKDKKLKSSNIHVIRQKVIEIIEDENDNSAVILENGAKISAKRSILVATGVEPDLSKIPIITENARPRCVILKRHDNYDRLKPQLDKVTESIAVYGNGLKAYQVSYEIAQEKPGIAVKLLDPGMGILSKYFPSYLTKYIEKQLKSKGVKCQSFKAIKVSSGPQGVRVISGDDREIDCNVLILDVPHIPRIISIRKKDGEMADTKNGLLCNSFMQYHPSIYIAGDVLMAKNRGNENHNHAKQSGRIAGLNMARAKENLQPNTHLTDTLDVNLAGVRLVGTGTIDNQLSTIGLWESDKNHANEPEYRRGAIIYYNDKEKIVKGVLLVNLPADRVDIAKQLLNEKLPEQFSNISSTLLNK